MTTMQQHVGDGRYHLDDPVDGPGPVPGVDTRLGRRVLVQRGERLTPSDRLAGRLAGVRHPFLAPLLDAGDDLAAGRRTAYAVYPATDLPTLTGAGAPTWSDLDLREVATVAAWLVAGVHAVHATCGPTVALCASDVVVDPLLLDDVSACPVRWMPALAERPGDLPDTVATLLASRGRRARRPLAGVVDLVTTAPGRPRAARLLADVAGLDPRVLGLHPRTPHRAGPERRLFGRRSLVGTIPTTKRRELACESVEAFS